MDDISSVYGHLLEALTGLSLYLIQSWELSGAFMSSIGTVKLPLAAVNICNEKLHVFV